MGQTIARQNIARQGRRAALWLLTGFLTIPVAAAPASAQPRYHTPPDNAHPLMQRQHEYSLPSLLVSDDGGTVESAEAWHHIRRPELMAHWIRVLGELGPTAADSGWFGDITQAVEISREQRDGYTRVELQLPMETDFLQPHLLLIPDHAAPGSCPAVIAHV